MKTIFFIVLFLMSSLFSDVSMRTPVNKPEVTLPVEKPIRPIRPVINTGIVYQDNYYNESYTANCQPYIDTLIQKDKEILALKHELQKLQNKEHQKLSKSLQKSYESELEAFENRKRSIKTHNSVTISKEPIE